MFLRKQGYLHGCIQRSCRIIFIRCFNHNIYGPGRETRDYFNRKSEMSKIVVGGAETFSVVDYPNKIAAVVFLQGCPWRCPFCYNTAVQKIGQPTDFIWERFLAFLHDRQGKLDAVVFSGGEPLVQDALGDAIDEVRALGYQIGLHTGGYRPEHLQKLVSRLDWVGMDIKAPFEAERYRQVTQTNHLDKVLQSLDILLSSGIDFECRTTCDPRLLTVEDIYHMAQDLAAKGVKKYFLQKYRPVPQDMVTTEADCEKLVDNQALLAQIKPLFKEFSVRK